MAPQPPPSSTPPPQPPSRSTQMGGDVAPSRRLPTIEDFPEAGPNALATFQQRGYARIVDTALVLPIVLLAEWIVWQVTGEEVTSSGGVPYGGLPLFVVAVAFGAQVLYEIIVIAVCGQSLGKWLFGIRVARYTDGTKPRWSQSALRCLLWAVPGSVGVAIFGQPVLGALPVFFTAWRVDLRRGLHDESGGTIVVRTR